MLSCGDPSIPPHVALVLETCRVVMAGLLSSLPDKGPSPTDSSEERDRLRSVVIEGLKESNEPKASSRLAADQKVVGEMLDLANLECRPLAVYRMGQVREAASGKPQHPRPLKVLLPASAFQRTLLRHARSIRLAEARFNSVWIRPSLTKEQREQEFKLREDVRECVPERRWRYGTALSSRRRTSRG